MINWLPLENEEQLQNAIQSSSESPIIIFKHSTRCFISKMALRNFESEFAQNNIKSYLLDLINYRSISNDIARQLEIQHQSPQLLIVSNGKVIHTSTHENIDGTLASKIVLE